MKRREFLKKLSVSGFLIINGELFYDAIQLSDQEEIDFRFIVASDGHYGEPDTDYKDYFSIIVEKVNRYHTMMPSEFIVFNGDLIHDEPQYIKPASEILSKTELPYFVTKGNHDRVTSDVWEKTWGYSPNHSVEYGDRILLLGTTSNVNGDYLCPDIQWFKQKLNFYRNASEVYIFLHITPNDWTDHGIECSDFHDLCTGNENITAIFNGHDHHEDGVKMLAGVPFMFDGHFGGSWGTEYRGFRVVEKLKNGTLRTYLMDPDKKINSFEI